MADKSIRKMQVPAYFPVESGVQAEEKRGVFVEVKNVMAIISMPIIDVLEDMSIAPGVWLAISMSVMVLGGAAVVIVMPSVDIVSVSLIPWPWERIAKE
jgi:hypothetical protein